MYVHTHINYTLSLEESLEMETLLNMEDIKSLLKKVNEYIAYKDNCMVGTWSYANHYVPLGKKPTVEPKGTFKPNSFMFKTLKDACIILSSRKDTHYVKELRVQTIPLPL